ncbi:hypothetical protein K1719_018647 [Acacia pycnantha]|nr:hypothetical protein K1719_018647 [Acacia pycnantha]
MLTLMANAKQKEFSHTEERIRGSFSARIENAFQFRTFAPTSLTTFSPPSLSLYLSPSCSLALFKVQVDGSFVPAIQDEENVGKCCDVKNLSCGFYSVRFYMKIEMKEIKLKV